MTITLIPEVEAKLQAKITRDGDDMDSIVNRLLATALEWDTFDYEEAIAGIQRGLEASAVGRVRPASEVFAQMHTTLKAGA